MKIGVLYPRSKAHPGMMADFADGIKEAMKRHQLSNEVDLISEIIGFGGNEKEVYEKVEKLLILEGVEMIVAYIDQRVIPILEPILQAKGRLMIVVNQGANYTENWIPASNIVYLTLQHSFLCWLTGILPPKNENRGAAVATSFYDCGYLHLAAISNCFMNNGGSIRYNYVNNNLYNETFEIKPLTDFLATEKEIQNLLCVFDTAPASLFYDRLNSYEESNKLHLYVSPMMLERSAWMDKEFNFSIEGYLPYHPAIDNKANAGFKNIFSTQIKKEITIFTLQGWETGLVIKEIINNCKDNYTDGASIINHLEAAVIDSPRGEMKLDTETNYFVTPVYKGMIEANTEDIQITTTGNENEEWKNFVANPVKGPSSGWTNTYLCY